MSAFLERHHFFPDVSEICGSSFFLGVMKSSCCNAFDFSMSWDGVLPSQAYVYFYQYFDYLRSLLTFWHLIDRLHFLHNLQNPAAPSFFCLFFCVKENYFLQLFLKKISAGY